MKKSFHRPLFIIALIMMMLCPLTMWADITPTQPSQGDGTEGSPYLISNAAELYWFAEQVNGGSTSINGKLTADITVNAGTFGTDGTWSESGTPLEWTPIGNYTNQFSGTFDGNGHTISGLYYNNPENALVGLCGINGETGTIKNLGVKNSYFQGYQLVALICGDNEGTISNCHSEGTVKGSYMTGGIAGYNINTISKCYSRGTVSITNDYVGGITGYNMTGGTISNCYSTVSVSGNEYVAGICGDNHATISYCYFAGTANGRYSVGAIEGLTRGSGSSVTNCYTNQDPGANSRGKWKSDDQFESGEVAYLLNGSTSEGTLTWFQTLGTDDYPHFTSTGSNIVYEANDAYCDGTASEYSNSSTGGRLQHDYVNGICTKKSGETHYQPATLVNGTYEISNVGQLYWFAEKVNGGSTSINGKLTADITVNAGTFGTDGTWSESGTPMSWTPMGYFSYSSGCFCNFAGTFDGDGHTISGLYYNNSETTDVGFFGVNAGTIKNLGIINSYFSGYSSVGGVCGYNKNGTISNCYSTGSVNSSVGEVGGICGVNEYNATISNSYSTCSVKGSGNTVGGFCGKNLYSSVISNCYSTGSVNGSACEVGGFCGINDESATISNCYSTGSAYGFANVGGFCGYNASAISNCYSTGSVSGTFNVYGFCWLDISATFSNCYTNQSTGEEDAGVQKTDAQFKSGEVTYLLNGSVSGGTTWLQTLGTDDYPHFTSNGSNTVYAVTDTYCDGSKGCRYSNSNTLVAINGHYYVNGICTKTSGETHYEPATLVDGYYQISNAGQLYWFAEQVNGGSTKINGKLTADITVNAGTFDADGTWSESGTPMSWTPMRNYNGTFDGNGHTISGLYYSNDGTNEVGFCGINFGTIKNLGIINNYFSANQYVGGICSANCGTISCCYFTGSVSGSYEIGGICGVNYATISNCYFVGTANGDGSVGGIEGFSGSNSSVTNCYTNQSIGNGSSVQKTDAQFKSGEVAYLLNGSVSGGTTWYQKLGTDDYPHFTSTGSNTVYCDYYNCDTEKSYANIKGRDDNPGHLDDGHNGICDRCGTVLSETEIYDLADGTAYTRTSICTAGTLNYTRSFNGKWQALYVPFAIDVDAVSDDYDIDYIIGVRQEDTDKDGVIDYQCMDVASMPAGSQTKPNYPYVIRKKTAENNAVMTLSGVTLQPAASKSISCNTTTNKYTMTGSYTKTDNLGNNIYAISSDGEIHLSTGYSLKPQRWSLSVESRSGAYTSPAKITINVLDDSDIANGIHNTNGNVDADTKAYNIAGQRVQSSSKGIIIKNGKKYFNK